MKKLVICITTISSLTIGVLLFFTYYDFTPSTKENKFGIHALVIHSPLYMGCPTVNCNQPNYYLKINSKSTTFLLGYNVCDRNSCVKQDGLVISLPLVDISHPDYRKLPLPDNLPWKDGDSVNIQVKISYSSIMDNTLYHDPSTNPKIWVDLGRSEIVRSS